MSVWRDPFWKADATPAEDNRRSSPRYHWDLEPYCPIFARLDDYPWPVRLENISAGGISLILKDQFAADTLLTVELLHSTKMQSVKIQVRVAHVKQYASGEWIMGCAFTRELNEEEQLLLLE